jgi:DnaJ-class molecular chaperone
VLVDVEVPTHLTERQRELLQQLAAESGELIVDGDGAPEGVPRTRKGKRSLGERIKDAIN